MCEFLNNNELCGKIKKYGDFCCKHKRNYLVKDNCIIIKRFTGKSSDYLKGDLIKSLNSKLEAIPFLYQSRAEVIPPEI